MNPKDVGDGDKENQKKLQKITKLRRLVLLYKKSARMFDQGACDMSKLRFKYEHKVDVELKMARQYTADREKLHEDLDKVHGKIQNDIGSRETCLERIENITSNQSSMMKHREDLLMKTKLVRNEVINYKTALNENEINNEIEQNRVLQKHLEADKHDAYAIDNKNIINSTLDELEWRHRDRYELTGVLVKDREDLEESWRQLVHTDSQFVRVMKKAKVFQGEERKYICL